jgi:Polyketide cyclase / dehydrase and lipid transport
MGTTIHMSKSWTFPVTVEEAFDRLLPMPLEALFTRWCGPIPPVRSTEQNGIWGTAGQRRVVRFVGPGSVRETLVRVDQPHEFSYELSEPTGPAARPATTWPSTTPGSLSAIRSPPTVSPC